MRKIEHGMVVDEHLGGYVQGGDAATFYPGLFDWLVNGWGVRSVLDVGCGEGHALSFFRDQGCTVTGVDGIGQDDPDIIQHDYTADGPLQFDRRYDLAWSCEFVEHIEEAFIPNFLETFADADTVLMTHAEPGQPGWHHVNCQDSSYWKGAMAAYGYVFDEVMTEQTRGYAAMNTNPHNHYVRSGLAFRRRPA